MALAEQFDLLELIQRDVAETWLAMEKSSKKRLLLHRFREASGLRQRLLSMGPADLIMLVSAEQEQDFYVVVTHDLPPLRQFTRWVKERSDAATYKGQVTSVPEITPSEAFDPDRTQLMTPRAPHPKAASGFEPMFEPPASEPSKSPFGDEAERITASASPRAEATSGEPGEFTRMFQTPFADPAKTSTSSRSGALPGREPRAEPVVQPGEFTRMFQAFPATRDAAPSMKAENPEKKVEEREPGEFTRLFYAPPKPQVAPAKPQPTPREPTASLSNRVEPKAEGPGEFTRMFETPFATRPEPARAKMQEPLPQPPVASKPSAGEFTKVFGRQSEEPERDAAFDGGRATGIFSRPQAPASSLNQASPASGPSEYTVIMRSPGPVQEAPPPPTQEATASKEAAKTPNTGVNAKNAVVLTIILAVLVIAAVALLLYFFLRR